MAPLYFHLPGNWLEKPSEMLPFYQKLTAGLADRAEVRLVEMSRDGLAERITGTPGVHILNHGRIEHPRSLNAGIAYVYPFWHLDPLGIRAFSSIGAVRFRAGEVDGEAAQVFFQRLKGRMVGGRISRYEQPPEREVLPKAGAAIFLQSEGHRVVGETLYLDRWTMVRAVLEAVQTPVLVKPHPRDFDPETGAKLEKLMAEFRHLSVTTANIHDVLQATERVVTINSAVGIEAYLYRKPLILCGKADFHHIADVVQTPQALQDALHKEVSGRPYAKYIHWYFGQQCLNAGAADLVDRAWERIAPLFLQ